MNATTLLQWQYMIYLLPLGISALLLLLSSLKLGHRGGHGPHLHGHASVGTHTHAVSAPASHSHVGAAPHAPAGATPHGPANATGGGARAGTHTQTGAIRQAAPGGGHPKIHARLGKVEVNRHGPNRENVTISTQFILQLTGADRAPLTMILELFCLVWGLCGYWANQYTLHTSHPTFGQMLPSLAIALGGGIIGARLGAEVIARIMPPDESQDVSRDGLFGLTGRIAFPVSAAAGRIHIYDEHGTLHDENCRVAPGHEEIARGRTALVVDMDPQGFLLVEEVPETVGARP